MIRRNSPNAHLPLPTRLRKRAGAMVAEGFFQGAARLGRLHPKARPSRHGVKVYRDIPYLDTGLKEHTLDVYQPLHRRRGPSPAVLYIHGGGFRILSKDTHWWAGLAFARRGYTVFNINYRLAPRWPYPAAVQDTAAALDWVARAGERYGTDPNRGLIITGESAGGNLTLAAMVMLCYRRSEPWAIQAWETGITPSAVIPACGLLQVSNHQRFLEGRGLSRFVQDRIEEPATCYLHNVPLDQPHALDLADPLVVLERGDDPDRTLPPVFAPCGLQDPILDDTRRLEAALKALDVPHQARYYKGAHAFHAALVSPSARACWRDTFAFLDALAPSPGDLA